ncbi:hypothetical protein PNK_2150 [Candidatus Protochlamydia naegleriophila]|uniref:Swiss Army Knife 2H phosphoesterase domain-containing protein n=1 Tax=Candidatus Protochlamydia naegleriophila TaxID=389348 RepID=A0A0U5JCN0_9BACT|nr:hypothetical protein [Candidatus Protochlamydia naegleriophila]CUI17753.1 hypothetical protein PNK_2150 [Candidatus Protochlamydia naegleriophila]
MGRTKRWQIKWLLSLVCLALATAAYFYQIPTSATEHKEAILEAAQKLPQSGVLKKNWDGYIYLKVDDDYIHQLFPLIHENGFHKPSSLHRPSRIGAHISVFYKDEAASRKPITEVGQSYSFRVKNFTHVSTKQKDYAIIEVDSPELEKLREKYGLPPKLFNHEFHITIGDKNKRYYVP